MIQQNLFPEIGFRMFKVFKNQMLMHMHFKNSDDADREYHE